MEKVENSKIPLLELDEISKSISGRKILEEISLQLFSGEVFGIFGPDGAGKSSLLKIMAGIWRPEAGRILIGGKPYAQLSPEIRKDIGYMAFEEGLYGDLSALENLEYAAALYDVPKREAQAYAETLLRKTDLYEFRNRRVQNFSGGMKQKLSLCSALLHRPKILLLDEPSTGVDPVSRRNFWKLLSELPEEGMAIVMTTPYLEEISHCQRVALLFEGEILMQGNPKGLYQSSGLRAVDFWPKHFLPALHYLESDSQVETYSVRGHAIHLVCPRETPPETGILRSLQQAGIVLDRYQTTEVDIEDLFSLQLQHPQSARVEVLEPSSPIHDAPQSGQGEFVVSSENLEKSFRGLQAVKPANFQIEKGEIFGLIGSNGAGKTTLIRMVCGLLSPDRGRVRLWGFDPVHDSAQVHSRIGYMSQAFSLYRQLTVRENLNFYGGIYSLKPEYLRERMGWILEITGLQEYADRPVGELAQALRQRLALSCALIHDPELIFLDEPTSGVDPVTRRYLWQWISLLAARGCTVVVSTHYMTEAEQCHRVMLMHQGEVLALGPPEEICSTENKKRALFELECQPLKPAVELCQNYPDVHSVVPFGNYLHILTSREHIPVRGLAQHLVERGIQLKSLSPIPYSIEDVFVEEISNREML